MRKSGRAPGSWRIAADACGLPLEPPCRGRHETAPTCARQDVECWALESGYAENTSGESRDGNANPGYLATGTVACCGEVECGEPMSRRAHGGF